MTGDARTAEERQDVERRAREIQRAIWLVGALTLAMVFAVAALGVIGYVSNRHRIHEIVSARRESEQGRVEARLTICRELNKIKTATRESLQHQLADSETFLRKNPRGIPGIPPRLIRLGIARLHAQVAQNADVDCEAFARNPTEIRHTAAAAPVVIIRGVPIPRRGD